MANRRQRAGIRLTPLGYLVSGILILVALVGIYYVIWSARDQDTSQQGAEPAADATSMGSGISQTPSLPPITTPSLVPIVTNSPAPLTSAPTVSAPAATTPGTTPPAVKTPTSSQKRNAVDGELTADGVNLRKGPDRSYDIIDKYDSGTELEVYEAEDDYYFVQIVDEGIYGYLAIDYVKKDGLLSGETASPTPKAPEGAVNGTVSASVVALRKMPTTEGNTPIGEVERGDAVFIYFKTGDFYYLQVVETGVKCYAKASFFSASGNVPTGTPIP